MFSLVLPSASCEFSHRHELWCLVRVWCSCQRCRDAGRLKGLFHLMQMRKETGRVRVSAQGSDADHCAVRFVSVKQTFDMFLHCRIVLYVMIDTWLRQLAKKVLEPNSNSKKKKIAKMIIARLSQIQVRIIAVIQCIKFANAAHKSNAFTQARHLHVQRPTHKDTSISLRNYTHELLWCMAW